MVLEAGLREEFTGDVVTERSCGKVLIACIVEVRSCNNFTASMGALGTTATGA